MNFNLDLSSWNVQNVTTLSHFCDYAEEFIADLSAWGDQFSNLRDISYGLANQIAFNNPSIENWNITNVENMEGFFGLRNFFGFFVGQPQTTGVVGDFSQWNPENVKNMRSVLGFELNGGFPVNFSVPLKFGGTGLENWTAPKLETVEFAFQNTKDVDARMLARLVSGDQLQSVQGLAYGTDGLRLDVSNWRTSNLEDFSTVFYNATNTNGIAGFEQLNYDNVITMAGAFAVSSPEKENTINPIFLEGKSFPNLRIASEMAQNNSSFDVNLTTLFKSASASIENLSYAFEGARVYTGEGTAALESKSTISPLIDVTGMFAGAEEIVPSLASLRYLIVGPECQGIDTVYEGTRYANVSSMYAREIG